ncbi:hypothetical protein ACQR16_35320 [Bradyrhizobium oligotrophicum]|uniref:hypothetical protein n=1 Tax=Bradyrhizobium oligotrophicum TaxID=44255 RepID=UPI003EB6EADC
MIVTAPSTACEPSAGLAPRLASALLSAAHGVIALPLGTPTMKQPDPRTNGRLVIGAILDAWTAKLGTARAEANWPRITLATFC